MLKNPRYVYGSMDVPVPVSLNFGDFILKKLKDNNDKRAFINGDTHEVLTYRRILQETVNFAISLRRLGVRKGDTVAICSENRLEFMGAMFGVVCAGAILTPLNLIYAREEMNHVINISKPKYIICSPFGMMMHEESFKAIKFIKKIIMFGDEPSDSMLLYNDLAIAGPNKQLTENISIEDFQPVDVEGQTDTLFILYSSGTTGLPKGVILTHYNVIATLCCAFFSSPQDDDDSLISLSIAPWFHAMGLMGSLAVLTLGRKTVFLPMFEVNQYLDTIEKYKITHLTVVPTVLVVICKTQTNHDVSSVKLVLCGAAPLNKETYAAVKARFPKLEGILQGYGMTESTLAIAKDTEDFSQSKEGAVGALVPGLTMKIVDIKTQEPLGPNKHGEICVKGPVIMNNYIGKDRKESFDEEGFFKTGDIGYYDEDGYLFIVDRLKELIKYKGYQVPPAEIEAVLIKHDAVLDAGVIGIDDRLAGEIPLAFVVLQPEKTVTEKELQDFVAKMLSNPKHLRGGVRFIDEIPRNAAGKILRKELKKMATKGKSKL